MSSSPPPSSPKRQKSTNNDNDSDSDMIGDTNNNNNDNDNDNNDNSKNNNNNNNNNIIWHDQSVRRMDRWKLNKNGHCGAVIWFTGLSGSGKSSIANQVEMILNHQYQIHTYLLDGDNIRHGLCKDLGFSLQDRTENIRRVGHVAKLMADAGIVVLTALISPYRKERDMVRSTVVTEPTKNDTTETVTTTSSLSFVEIHVKASLSTCEGRDPKGLYKLARQGKIKNFTGIDDPYEEPLSPEIVLDSDTKNVLELAEETISWLKENVLYSSTTTATTTTTTTTV